MNKRLVVKTVLISFGIYIFILSIAAYFFLQNYEPVNENTYRVLVAKTDIEAGSEIGMQMVEYRTIRVSGLNKYMLQDTADVVGKKAIGKTVAGDYLRSYNLLAPGQWYAADERAIVLAMDMEDRLGNLIKKGSFVDIKVILNDIKTVPQTVLSKVSVENLIDENGISLNATNQNAKKVYAEFCLNEEQRNKIYAAKKMGKLIYELHLDPIQPKVDEEFIIPQGFLSQNSSSSSLVISAPTKKEKVRDNPSTTNQQTGHVPETIPSIDPAPTYKVKGIPGYN